MHKPPEPWRSFLRDLDDAAGGEVFLHCIGGFVVTMLYGLQRPTADIDVLEAIPAADCRRLFELAQEGSLLHRKHRVYLDKVGIITPPDSYEERLTEMFERQFAHIRLFALDPYDLALTKLERNIQRDRDDMKFLARSVPFDLEVLRQRYEIEMRPYLTNEMRHDNTLKLWIDAIREERELT